MKTLANRRSKRKSIIKTHTHINPSSNQQTVESFNAHLWRVNNLPAGEHNAFNSNQTAQQQQQEPNSGARKQQQQQQQRTLSGHTHKEQEGANGVKPSATFNVAGIQQDTKAKG